MVTIEDVEDELEEDSSLASFIPGTYVRIQGLVSAENFNGKIGIVKSFNEENQRYQVELLTPTKKLLGVKPEKLQQLAKDLSLPPKTTVPNEKGDENDERDGIYESAVQLYMELASKVGRAGGGTKARELQMYEWLVHGSSKIQQPLAYTILFLRYSGNSDSTKGNEFWKDQQPHQRALECLLGAVELLVGPDVELPSYPKSMDELAKLSESSSPHKLYSDAKENAIAIDRLIHLGMKFIINHRVTGRSGKQTLGPEAKVLSGLYQLALRSKPLSNNYPITHKVRSDLLFHLGNVFRKMSETSQAIDCLTLANFEAEAHFQTKLERLGYLPIDDDDETNTIYPHHFDALLLRVDVRMFQLAKDMPLDPNKKREALASVVFEARTVHKLMQDSQYPQTYKGTIKLAQLLQQQMQLTRESPTHMLKEARALLKEGREQAQKHAQNKKKETKHKSNGKPQVNVQA